MAYIITIRVLDDMTLLGNNEEELQNKMCIRDSLQTSCEQSHHAGEGAYAWITSYQYSMPIDSCCDSKVLCSYLSV